MMITDPKTYMDEAIYGVLSEINPNTTTRYPPGLFTGKKGVALPITIYEVECYDTEMSHGTQRYTSVIARVDTFAESQESIEGICVRIRTEMLKILYKCDVDRADNRLPRGVVRRSFRFSGRLDHHTGIVYRR